MFVCTRDTPSYATMVVTSVRPALMMGDGEGRKQQGLRTDKALGTVWGRWQRSERQLCASLARVCVGVDKRVLRGTGSHRREPLNTTENS